MNELTSLERALLPDRDNPLLPQSFIPNTGLGATKVVGRYVVTVTKPVNTSLVEAITPHGLGYLPTLLGYYVLGTEGGIEGNNPTQVAPLPYTQATTSGANLDVSILYTCNVDKTNIHSYIQCGLSGLIYSASITASFQYLLLYDGAKA